LMAASSASATGYLLLPVGAIVTGLSLPGTLAAGGNTISCEKDNFTATIASVHLIGPFAVHFLGCTAASASGSGCPANSTGASGGLILTTTLHALIGLALPGNSPALLVLPASGKKFVTIAKSTEKSGTETVTCAPETAVNGNVAGLLLQTVGLKTTTALLDFVPEDPRKIDLPLGGTITPEIEAFGVEGKFTTQVHLSYNELVELMP
jgi:hypothetical protein